MSESLEMAKSLLSRLWNCEYWAREPYWTALEEWVKGVENPIAVARELKVDVNELQVRIIQLDGLCESGIWDEDLRVLFEEAFQEHLFKCGQLRCLEERSAMVGQIGWMSGASSEAHPG